MGLLDWLFGKQEQPATTTRPEKQAPAPTSRDRPDAPVPVKLPCSSCFSTITIPESIAPSRDIDELSKLHRDKEVASRLARLKAEGQG